jgi:hypothetical protein
VVALGVTVTASLGVEGFSGFVGVFSTVSSYLGVVLCALYDAQRYILLMRVYFMSDSLNNPDPLFTRTWNFALLLVRLSFSWCDLKQPVKICDRLCVVHWIWRKTARLLPAPSRDR